MAFNSYCVARPPPADFGPEGGAQRPGRDETVRRLSELRPRASAWALHRRLDPLAPAGAAGLSRKATVPVPSARGRPAPSPASIANTIVPKGPVCSGGGGAAFGALGAWPPRREHAGSATPIIDSDGKGAGGGGEKEGKGTGKKRGREGGPERYPRPVRSGSRLAGGALHGQPTVARNGDCHDDGLRA